MILGFTAFFIAALGTLIGVGGGFVFVPLLLFLYPDRPSVWITAMSMWLISFNATSGSIAYLRKGRVHLKAAAVFIVAALPGSLLGVWAEHLVSRASFEMIFGVSMGLYSIYLFFKKPRNEENHDFHAGAKLARHLYVNGAVISFFVGFLSAFLGIGGGVVHVPLLVHALGFPVHMATGTSHFILAATAIFTAGAHIWNGHLDIADTQLWWIALGAAAGAQLGAFLSGRISGQMILRLLSVALFAAGLRLVLGHL